MLAILEKDREFSITISNGNFTIRIPLPLERATIIAQTARGLGGLDVKSFPPDDYEYVKIIITLNNIIIKSPDWWKGADACPDNSILVELWKFYQDSEIKFQEFLKKNNSNQSLAEPRKPN